ncbi:helix-turn-helix domain-containing protein [Streptomyces spectabilis]|uniref:helix-turn-helix domain-containing protein n=1 Tax=Streptomyces spectabilis TaxID=68270 RepID=UPI0033EE1387
MSIQLMIAAAYLPPDVLSQSQKLALMKIADSADDETRLARPGLTRLAAWVGVTDKRAITIVTELIAKGLVERVETGKAGRAAVYRVFPLGVPPTPTTAELKSAAEARKAAPKNPRKARSGVTRSAPAKPAMTYQDVEARRAARAHTIEEPQAHAGFQAENPGRGGGFQAENPGRGGGFQAENPGRGGGFHVRNPDEEGFHGGNPGAENGSVPPVEPERFHPRNPLGSSGETPSFPGSSSALPFPPPPTAGAVREPAPADTDAGATGAEESTAGCERHRGRPAASCRGCGTNPRSGRQRQQEALKAVEREQASRFWDAWHQGASSRRQQAGERAEAAEAARREARQALLQAKGRRRKETLPPE